jgi:transposase
MDAIFERVCGIDVHKGLIVACVLKEVPGKKKPKAEIRRFEAFRSSLLELKQWLRDEGVQVIGMEATGTYWVPVWEVLEEGGLGEVAPFVLQLLNAREVKNVPGRKTDMADALWLATLLAHGLVRASFVPPRELRDLRDVLRTRRSFIETRTNHQNQIGELLERSQIKLGNVVSDLFGKTGRSILDALTAGVTDPATLAQMAKGALRNKIELLTRALDGRFRPQLTVRLKAQLALIDVAERQIAELEKDARGLLAPYTREVERLCDIPGIADHVAWTIIAEVGADMSIFGTSQRLCSWAGVCPGNNKSAGKTIRGREAQTRPGNRHLKAMLVQAAWGAVHTKGSSFRTRFFRLKGKLGSAKKAIMAIAHSLLRICFALLSNPTSTYREQSEGPVTQPERDKQTQRALRQLQKLGYTVSLASATTPEAPSTS